MPYTPFDHFVAWCRFRAVARHIAPLSDVCDIGSGPGAPFLHHVAVQLRSGVGLDEHVAPSTDAKIKVLQADITQPLPLPGESFDHVTLLAVLEHLAQPEPVLREAHRILRRGGTLIMTWPSAAVDPILEVLTRIGMVNHDLGFDQHQPRIPVAKLKSSLQDIGFAQINNGTFELGLNNWLVARKGGS